MACDQSLLYLLRTGSSSTIAVLAGIGLGSFLLGVLVTVMWNFLRSRRVSRAESPETPQMDAYRHSIAQKSVEDVFAQPQISPKSLSQTFVRHSLKPPVTMFSAGEKSGWNDLQDYSFPPKPIGGYDPFGSVGNSSFSSAASEEATLCGRGESSRGHQAPLQPPGIVISRCSNSQDLPTTRHGFRRSRSDPNVQETHGTTNNSTINSHSNESSDSSFLREFPSKDLNRLQRVGSESQIVRAGKERTQYDISTRERHRLRTFSSPAQQRTERRGSHKPAALDLELQQVDKIRKPQLTIPSPLNSFGITDSPIIPNTASTIEQGADLTRRTSSRQAAAFYQQHATRHLSLPHGGPLASAVLPESPCGVIGNSGA